MFTLINKSMYLKRVKEFIRIINLKILIYNIYILMSKFILIVGNLNVSDLSRKIPDQFLEYFKPGKIDIVICSGNVGNRKCLNLL